MAGLYSARVNPIRKRGRNLTVDESRSAINFINFPSGGRVAGVSFALPATRTVLTPAPLRAIRAA